MDQVETAIQAALVPIPARAAVEQWSSDAKWTLAVKEALVAVGRNFGWLTAANGCDSDEGKEWLYDVVWYQLDRSGHMTDVPFVAECEWGRESAIKEDFEKLLVARSKYRVMVFQAESEEAVGNLFHKMCLWISKFHRTNTGDRYFLAGWAKHHWLFEFYVA